MTRSALRRADESAKDPGASVPGLRSWLPTMELVAAGEVRR